jgi:hypothetical protein
MTRIPAGHADDRVSRPVSSATQAPSRTPPSASSAGLHAELGRAVIAARSSASIRQPIEYSTRRRSVLRAAS